MADFKLSAWHHRRKSGEGVRTVSPQEPKLGVSGTPQVGLRNPNSGEDGGSYDYEISKSEIKCNMCCFILRANGLTETVEKECWLEHCSWRSVCMLTCPLWRHHDFVGRTWDLESDRPGFESGICHFKVVSLWIRHSLPLSLSLFDVNGDAKRHHGRWSSGLVRNHIASKKHLLLFHITIIWTCSFLYLGYIVSCVPFL